MKQLQYLVDKIIDLFLYKNILWTYFVLFTLNEKSKIYTLRILIGQCLHNLYHNLTIATLCSIILNFLVAVPMCSSMSIPAIDVYMYCIPRKSKS